jgi:hypothetical protein
VTSHIVDAKELAAALNVSELDLRISPTIAACRFRFQLRSDFSAIAKTFRSGRRHFLRQPNNPMTPKPTANSGKAAGSGVGTRRAVHANSVDPQAKVYASESTAIAVRTARLRLGGPVTTSRENETLMVAELGVLSETGRPPMYTEPPNGFRATVAACVGLPTATSPAQRPAPHWMA